jgi:hypothetical protein
MYYQYKTDQARRSLRGIDEQVAKAAKAGARSLTTQTTRSMLGWTRPTSPITTVGTASLPAANLRTSAAAQDGTSARLSPQSQPGLLLTVGDRRVVARRHIPR